MANPFLKKAEEKKSNPFLARRKTAKAKRTPSSKEVAVNGVVGMAWPELSGLKLLKRKKEWAVSDKEDFSDNGVRICHVREWDGFWTIDVINGDETFRFDNRGNWLIEIGNGVYREPVHWLKVLILQRWYRELKRQGRPAPWDGISNWPTEDKSTKKRAKK